MPRFLSTRPEITGAELAWFGGMMCVSVFLAALISPRRRRAIGSFKYLFAWAVIVAPALFGAICIRGGYALTYKEAGMNPFEAQVLGGLWGIGFIIVARIALLLFPPSAWLLREWQRANREASLVRAAFRPRGPAA